MDWNEQDFKNLAFVPHGTKDKQIRLPDTPSTANDVKESSSPYAATVQHAEQKKFKTQHGKKLVIILILVLCLSVGGLVLGLINLLNKENCSCFS